MPHSPNFIQDKNNTKHTMKTLTAAVLGALFGCTTAIQYSSDYIANNQDSMWKSFKTTYSRTYDTVGEEVTRKAIFVSNLHQMIPSQFSNPDATFGPNRFSDLTSEEFLSQRTTGASHAGLTETGATHTYSENELAAVQSEVGLTATNPISPCRTNSVDLNWADAGVLGTVPDQGNCSGGGWAYAAVGAIEAQLAIRGHPLIALSQQELLSCVSAASGCTSGSAAEAYKWVAARPEGKLATEEAYSGVSADSCPADATLDTLSSGAPVLGFTQYASDEVQMYMALKSHGPVSVVVDVTTNWQSYTSGILTNCSSTKPNHAVLLVGHGFTSNGTVQQEYWVIRNSWGDSWGDKGYMRIAYGENTCLIRTAPTSPKVEVSAPVPGVLPVWSSPEGTEYTPGVINYDPVDPMLMAPKEIDEDVTCIGGSDCDCSQVCFSFKFSSWTLFFFSTDARVQEQDR